MRPSPLPHERTPRLGFTNTNGVGTDPSVVIAGLDPAIHPLKERPAQSPCFRVVLYNEYCNFNVSPLNGDSNPRRDCGTAPTATAPVALGGRRPADRPSSAPGWASPPATAWGGARRR